MILFILHTKNSQTDSNNISTHLSNSLHRGSMGHRKRLLWGGALDIFWQLQAFVPTQKSCSIREERKGRERERTSLKSPSLFLSEHISSRSCFYSVNVREQAQAVRTENRDAHWQFPCWHSTPITAGEFAVPLHRAACSLAEASRWGAEPWKRPCLCLSHTCTERSCYGHSCEGEEGRRVKAQPISPRVLSATLHPATWVSSVKWRNTRKN